MEKLTTIRLYGTLGAKFGRVHRIAVSSPAEAVKALSVVLQGFQSYLIHAKKNGMTFAVFRGKTAVTVGDLHGASGSDDIRIAPVLEGAKSAGLFQTILGAVLIVAAVALGPVGLAAVSGSTAWGIGLAGGAALAGGLVQMLSPQPQGLMNGSESADNKPSYAFGGAVNTVAMGNPIGVLYGIREIGGAIVSAGILAEDIAT